VQEESNYLNSIDFERYFKFDTFDYTIILMSFSGNVPMFLYKISEQKSQRKLKLNLMQILVLFLDKFSVAFKI